jgi:hypothetical protein
LHHAQARQSVYGVLWHVLEQKNQVSLRRYRFQKAVGTDDFHHPLQMGREHIQAHLRAYPFSSMARKYVAPIHWLSGPKGC